MLKAKKEHKILVVDDSRFNRAVITSMLEKDYFLEEACNGKEALLILEDHAEEFALVLTDLVMPNMDGFDLLKAMKERGWLDFLPVIMISSDYTDDNINTAYSLGASELIQRPFNERVICHRIDDIIDLSGRQQELSNALVNEMIQENETNSAMISILSHIVETRNGESGSHVRNIRTITRMLLEELTKVSDRYAFSSEEKRLICTASSLHDIGKMTVPEEILNKPGRFTEEEFQIMKGHAMAGANMVDALRRGENTNALMQLTYEICRWHHERYDGKGYPDGLKGEEIPITAQIVSVADVYDALVSERCYKPSHTPEEAFQMILDGQCGTFNPLLMTCLSNIFDELKGALTVSGSAQSESGGDSAQELVEEAVAHLHEHGVAATESIAQELNRERLRFKFFFNGAYPGFYYTVSPAILYYNRAAMKLFGIEDPVVVMDTEQTPYEKYDRGAADRLRRKLSTATNAHPLIRENISLDLPGEEPRPYRCELQTVWDSPHAGRYTEVMGRLIPLDGELPALPDAGERGQLPAVGSEMTGRQVCDLIKAIKFMVYNVRLVDPTDNSVLEIDGSGRLVKTDQPCYRFWKQEKRCANCSSMRCLAFRKEFSKIVLLDGEVFHVISRYIKVDGKPLVLETLVRITEDTLLDGNGETLPVGSLFDMHSQLYLDPATCVYNRRYYDTETRNGEKIYALAVLNVDHFQDITDTYGRKAGDNLLMRVAQTIHVGIREPDTLIHYCGSEFVMLFASIHPDALEARLNKICGDISALSINGTENGPYITASIGGAMGPDAPDTLLKKADEMLLKARLNRGRVELWRQDGEG
nr:HD domain-containing phosphohydrolase [uncultured Oscillibacter sp.]